MRIVLLLMLCCSFANINAQNTENKPIKSPTFSVEALQEDFSQWRNRVEKKHPLIYFYHSKKEIDATFDSSYASIQTPMTEIDFFRLLSFVTTKINDGHNFINPSSNVIQEILKSDKLLPLDIQLLDNKLFITNNLSTIDLPKIGNQIHTINGVSASNLIKEMLAIIPSDAYTPYSKSIFSQYFRFYYHICFGLNKDYLISYQDADEVKKINLTGSTLKEIRSRNKYSTKEKCIQFKMIDSLKTAILTLSTFSDEAIKKDCGLKFKKVIQAHFETIQNTNTAHLILDLRNNNGGNPASVKFVLKRLMNQTFQQNVECRVVKHPNEEDFWKRTTKRWYPAYGLGKIRPVKNPYKGKIYVLINEGTFSAGVDLAYALKKYSEATFIGQETGGNPIIMGGYLLKTSWELSNTKIQVSPATLCTLSDDLDKNKGRGLLPDYVIEHSFSDSGNIDKYIDFTLDLIK